MQTKRGHLPGTATGEQVSGWCPPAPTQATTTHQAIEPPPRHLVSSCTQRNLLFPSHLLKQPPSTHRWSPHPHPCTTAQPRGHVPRLPPRVAAFTIVVHGMSTHRQAPLVSQYAVLLTRMYTHSIMRSVTPPTLLMTTPILLLSCCHNQTTPIESSSVLQRGHAPAMPAQARAAPPVDDPQHPQHGHIHTAVAVPPPAPPTAHNRDTTHLHSLCINTHKDRRTNATHT